jgi:membrane protein implicated in regulation of membrane protease activity
MSEATIWWIVAGVLVGAEMVTGTFYLLMLALGAGAAAVAAHLGASTSLQLVVAAVGGGGAITAWHLLRPGRRAPPAAANRDVNLDIGERVHVPAWQPDGTARVHYRGAPWSARYAGSDPPQPGDHRIQAIEGSCLVLGR